MEIEVAIGPPAVKFHNSFRAGALARLKLASVVAALRSLSCRNMGQSWELAANAAPLDVTPDTTPSRLANNTIAHADVPANRP